MYLTTKQDKEIKKIAKEAGLAFADVVRRILDYYIENERMKDITLMRVNYPPLKGMASSLSEGR